MTVARPSCTDPLQTGDTALSSGWSHALNDPATRAMRFEFRHDGQRGAILARAICPETDSRARKGCGAGPQKIGTSAKRHSRTVAQMGVSRGADLSTRQSAPQTHILGLWSPKTPCVQQLT